MFANVSLQVAGVVLVTIALALAVLERLRKGPLSAAPALDSDPAPLHTAAELAYEYANAQHLPIAAVAARKNSPVTWFENSLLRSVPVSVTSLETGKTKVLSAMSRTRMRVVADGIAESANGAAVFTDPMVTARDFKAYLRWARSMW